MNFISSAFISFYIVGGGVGQNTPDTPSYNPSNFLELNVPIECGINRVEGVVSVHDYFMYQNIEVLGWIDVHNDISPMYSVHAFNNVTITETVKVTNSTSLNFTRSFSYTEQYKMSTELNILDVVEIDFAATTQTVYSIENQLTYSNSVVRETQISYNVNENVLEGKNRFKIGTIAYVYKIDGLHYEAWDWWRNHYDIDENSYVYFTNYVVCEPFTTIIFDDGSFVF